MKIGSLRNITGQDINCSDQGANLLNQTINTLDDALNNGLDLGNNFKGKLLDIEMKPGVAKFIPSTLPQYVNVLKITPTLGGTDIVRPSAPWWKPVNGGFNLTLWWDGEVTSAKVSIFIGVL